ncbi:hypothetical protein LCGC14_2912320, partial [marine sediment metagenome]
MTNGIAPLKEVSVEERIKEIESFLNEEEAAIIKAPFKGEYESRSGFFKGKVAGDIDLPAEESAEPATEPSPTPTPAPIIPPAPETYTDESLKLLSII